MLFARAAFLSLVVALAAPQAFAQDVDIPLPSSGGSKKAKATKRRGSQKAPAKKPVPAASADEDLDVPLPSPAPGKKPQPSDDLDVPLPTPKPPTAKNPEPAVPDEDLIPTVGKSSLVLKLGAGAKGARLFVDNKDMGTLPLPAPIPLDAGEHALVVRKPGFGDFSRRITAQKTRPTEVAVTLEAVAGVVSVTAETPGATVSINGQPRGQVPVIGVILKPGTYEIVVSKEGFEPDKQSLAVKAGKEYTVVASPRPSKPVAVARNDRPEQPNLKPPPPTVTNPQPNPLAQTVPEVEPSQPWFKRWYVWAGVGVVAAATTGAVLATRGGKLSDKDVCGPAGCDGVINGIRPAGAR
jgi:PEGA domain